MSATIVTIATGRGSRARYIPAHPAKAATGRYIRWSAAKSDSGKIEELGISKISPARNHLFFRAAQIVKPANSTHEAIAAARLTLISGSIVKPYGSSTSRRYRKITNP